MLNEFKKYARPFYWKMQKFRALLCGTTKFEKQWESLYQEDGEKLILDSWEDRFSLRRQYFRDYFKRHVPFESVLEFGCHCGCNLYGLAKEYPELNLMGIDVNPQLIKMGRALLGQEELGNISLRTGNVQSLKEIGDKSIDVVFTDAVLIYVGPDQIHEVFDHFKRIARKSVILQEWHHDEEKESLFYKGFWVWNYRKFFSDKTKINITKIPPDIWPADGWRKYGNVIEIEFE